MMKELGEKIPSWMKWIIGGALMVFILALISVPMLLFSSINPVGIPNPVSQAELQFYIVLKNSAAGTNSNVNLFLTDQIIKNGTLNQTQSDNLQFNNVTSDSYIFTTS